MTYSRLSYDRASASAELLVPGSVAEVTERIEVAHGEGRLLQLRFAGQGVKSAWGDMLAVSPSRVISVDDKADMNSQAYLYEWADI